MLYIPYTYSLHLLLIPIPYTYPLHLFLTHIAYTYHCMFIYNHISLLHSTPRCKIVDIHLSYKIVDKHLSYKIVYKHISPLHSTPRCKIVDKHLSLLAPKHVETRFVKIDVEKCQFLAERLRIVVMPTIALVREGKVLDYVVG